MHDFKRGGKNWEAYSRINGQQCIRNFLQSIFLLETEMNYIFNFTKIERVREQDFEDNKNNKGDINIEKEYYFLL